MTEQIYIFVRDGMVHQVLDGNGNIAEHVIVVDWDVEMNGICPGCLDDLDLDEPLCPECGLESGMDDVEAVEVLERYFEAVRSSEDPE